MSDIETWLATKFRPIKILRVDDDEKTLMVFRANMSKYHVICRTAGTIAEALDRLVIEDYDVLICDVRLPDGNGIQLFQRVRDSHPDMQVVFVSAYITQALLEEVCSIGCAPVFPKPADAQPSWLQDAMRRYGIHLKTDISQSYLLPA